MGPLHIYRITNLQNGKIYIGKTSLNPPQKRWKSHLNTVRRGPDDHHRYQYVHRAINKHGVRSFRFEVIATYDDEKEWTQAEIDFIARFKSNDRKVGYNLTIGGDGARGYRFSPAQRRRMSERKKREYIGPGNPFFGKHHARETRRRIGELAAKRFADPTKNPFFRRRHSAASKAKMSANCHRKERYLSVEQVEEARHLFVTGQHTQAQLAKKFGVTIYVIENAVLGKRAYAAVGSQVPKAPDGRVVRACRPPRHSLAPELVAELRRKARQGGVTCTDLARPLGLHPALVSSAVGGYGSYASFECEEPPIRHEKSSSLPAENVDQVRQLYATGKFTYAELGKKFGVSGNVIRHAVLGRQRYAKIGTPLPKTSGRWTKKAGSRVENE